MNAENTKSKMRQDLYKELFEVEDNHWWHQHKRAIVHKLIQKFSKKGRVLDIGAGTGKILEELKKTGWKISGLDGAKEAVFWSKKRGVAIKNFDFENNALPFPENSFDLVLSLDVLEHIKSEKKLLLEIKRVVKPGGVVIITAPAYQRLFGYWDRMVGHKRRYSRKSLKTMIESLNFKILFLSYFSCLVLLPAILVRLVKTNLKKRGQLVSDFQTLPLKTVSEPLIRLYCSVERLLLSRFKMPFGLSIIMVAGKQSL